MLNDQKINFIGMGYITNKNVKNIFGILVKT